MFIRHTRTSKIGAKYVKGFPLLLNSDKSVHWVSLEYFFELKSQGIAVSSIATYASQLLDFQKQLEIDGINYEQVSDAWLEAYKDSILDRASESTVKNSDNYASQLLRTVVAFLWWLEQNEYTCGVVGVRRTSAVRITETKRGVRHWLAGGAVRGKKNTATPRHSWILAIKPYGPQRPDLAERFELMIDWGKTLGLRAMEVCSLPIADLPTNELAEAALHGEYNLRIEILSKGGLRKRVPVSPLLVKNTWQYINSSRNVIIKRQTKIALQNYELYSDPGFVFLSNETGDRVHPKSYSNSVRSAYLKAVDEGDLVDGNRVWAHGLRHNFVVTVAREMDKLGISRADAVARQITRHGSEDAMEPYLIDRYDDSFDEKI